MISLSSLNLIVILVLHPEKFQEEIDRVISTTENLIREGKTVTVYTKRERLDLGEGKKEEELKLSVQISDAVTSIVQRLECTTELYCGKRRNHI